MAKAQKVRTVGKTREAAAESLLVFFSSAIEVMLSFLIWPATVILAVVFHMVWPASPYVLAFLCIVPLIITPFVMILDPGPSKALGAHVGAVTGLISALLFTIDLTGFTQIAIFGLVALVPLLCLTLAIRAAMNKKGNNGLAGVFEQAGIPGATMKIHPAKTAKTKD